VHARRKLAGALLCAAVFAATLGSGAASGRLVVGIGDESPTTFSDPSYQALGVKRTRLIAFYDVELRFPGYYDNWINQATAHHQQIMVAFNPGYGSKCPSQPCKLASSKRFTAAFKAFHARYPQVKIFQPWNEVNSPSQPTAHHPEAVVAYYSIVKKYCKGCTVVGADIEDLGSVASYSKTLRSNFVKYSQTLLADFKKAHVAIPKLWGLHNYVDVNYFHSTGTAAALATLPGQVWLTETGGIAKFVRSDGHVNLKYDLKRQAKATNWMMQLALKGKRIARVYIYDLFYGGQIQRFDSALLGPGAVPRQAYYALAVHWKGYFR
jgi:hypothetical protein